MQVRIDLRSDTVSTPTMEMRRSMAEAEVGDDILRDDPTVIRLEERAAEMLGMEAALFTASGTMSNEIAIAVFCRPGDAAIVSRDSHILTLETGAMAAIAGVQPDVVADDCGRFDLEALKKAVQRGSVQTPHATLLCLENSFHLNRGLALSPADYRESISVAHDADLKVLMDGARIFNSAAALGIGVDALVQGCDAAAFCLCKGLGAPVGSILAGSRSFIDEARRIKQRLGGGWRQAGVLAAPALIGLEKMSKRLSIDHEHAETLRQGLEAFGIHVDRSGVLTNIVYLDLTPIGIRAVDLGDALALQNIKVKICNETAIRMVTHHDISADHVSGVLQAIDEIINK